MGSTTHIILNSELFRLFLKFKVNFNINKASFLRANKIDQFLAILQ